MDAVKRGTRKRRACPCCGSILSDVLFRRHLGCLSDSATASSPFIPLRLSRCFSVFPVFIGTACMVVIRAYPCTYMNEKKKKKENQDFFVKLLQLRFRWRRRTRKTRRPRAQVKVRRPHTRRFPIIDALIAIVSLSAICRSWFRKSDVLSRWVVIIASPQFILPWIWALLGKI